MNPGRAATVQPKMKRAKRGKADRHSEGTDQKSFMFSGCASNSTASRFFMAWLK